MNQISSKPGHAASHGKGQRFVRAFALGCAGLLLCADARTQTLEDYFTNRLTVTAANGQIHSNNSTNTLEPGEPKHGGKTGGHSMWMTWVAPTNGVVEFKTEGSRFDTLLSAYYFPSTNDTSFGALVEAARADDSEGFERESEVKFPVLAGRRYEIAVDGYFGASGPLELKWEFESVSVLPPIVLSAPGDRSVNQGEAVTLTVALTNAANGQFKWFFNTDELSVTTSNLLISNFQSTNVGRYKMRITVEGSRYETIPAEIQINTDGATDTLARSKLLDAPATPLIGGGGGSTFAPVARGGPSIAGANGDVGVVRGYNGSQIFNTIFATVDTNEPPHCGIPAGASYWLLYQPPTNGTITLDTVGSTYDTAMEVYTFNGLVTGYQDLISIDCANDSFGTNGPSRVQFPVVKSRQYLVVVTGVNGARGTAWLNYSINTNQHPTAPILLSQPNSVTVAQGSPATLTASLAGSPPLHFSWKKNATPMPGVTAPGIFFPSAMTNDTADYVMTVTNDLGSLSATLPLHVVISTQCSLTRGTNSLQISFPTMSGQRYTVEEAGAVSGPWLPWPTAYFGNDELLELNLTGDGTKFFRVRVE